MPSLLLRPKTSISTGAPAFWVVTHSLCMPAQIAVTIRTHRTIRRGIMRIVRKMLTNVARRKVIYEILQLFKKPVSSVQLLEVPPLKKYARKTIKLAFSRRMLSFESRCNVNGIKSNGIRNFNSTVKMKLANVDAKNRKLCFNLVSYLHPR